LDFNSSEAAFSGSMYAGAADLSQQPIFKPQSELMPQQPSGFSGQASPLDNAQAQALQYKGFQSELFQPMTPEQMAFFGQPSTANPFQYQPTPKKSNGFSSQVLSSNNAQVHQPPSFQTPSHAQQQPTAFWVNNCQLTLPKLHSRQVTTTLEQRCLLD
jgi:hypothetical protein